MDELTDIVSTIDVVAPLGMSPEPSFPSPFPTRAKDCSGEICERLFESTRLTTATRCTTVTTRLGQAQSAGGCQMSWNLRNVAVPILPLSIVIVIDGGGGVLSSTRL